MLSSDHVHPDVSGQVVGLIAEYRSPDGRTTRSRAKGRGSRTATWEPPKTWPECLARQSALAVPSVRREWLDAGLTLVGAVLGWLTPLLLMRIGSGPGGNFYEYGDAILCPLFACFGAGLGSMSGGLWRTRHRGVRNGHRKSPK